MSTKDLPYIEVELQDGQIARQCRATLDCKKRSSFIFQRLRMMDHLKVHHGIDIEIEKRAGGRPTHKEATTRANTLSHPDKKNWQKATIKRFEISKKSCKQTRKMKEVQALQVWEELRHNHKDMTKDQFVESFVAEAMRTYIANKAHKIGMIQSRIDRGFKANMRVRHLSNGLDMTIEADEKLDPSPKAPFDKEGTKNISQEATDNHVAISMQGTFGDVPFNNVCMFDGPIDANMHNMTRNLVETLDEKLQPRRKKLSLRKRKISVPTSPIDTPLLEEPSLSLLKFCVSSGQVEVEMNGKDDCPPTLTQNNIALHRLSLHMNMELSSSYLRLSMDIDDELVRKILWDEASTRTVNLFSMWMEHILPSAHMEHVHIMDAMWFNIVQT